MDIRKFLPRKSTTQAVFQSSSQPEPSVEDEEEEQDIDIDVNSNNNNSSSNNSNSNNVEVSDHESDDVVIDDALTNTVHHSSKNKSEIKV